tara:strand:+ start:1727 stop:1954 length:228 start_codon:yes stop_codon:yes gene_type:complete
MDDTASPPRLIPRREAADMANAAAIAAIMLQELYVTVREIEGRLTTNTASRTDVIQTENIAKARSKAQQRAMAKP